MEKKEFTLEELKTFNGEGGRPIYVAHQGRVFDLTASNRWKGGRHMNRHQAGGDLSTDIASAPHGPEMLDSFPQAGILKSEAAGPTLPRFMQVLLDRFPMLQRHPHPMVVHFPIVFMISNPVFTVLYLLTGWAPFETTAFHLLGGGVIFALVGIATGFLTWWLNYQARRMTSVTIKIVLSFSMLILAAIAFFWRLTTPDILMHLTGLNIVYLVMVLLLMPLVSITGYFGAELTFPTHKGGRR